MHELKTVQENDATESVSEDRFQISKNRRKEKLFPVPILKLAKKRKISDDTKSSDKETRSNEENYAVNTRKNDVMNRLDSCRHIFQENIPSCSKTSDSKSTQSLLPSLQDTLKEELRCSICKEIFINAVTLNCSHSFCGFCISQWKKEQITCPICRQEITSQSFSLVLDKCVDRVLEFSSEKMKQRRMKILLNRERQIELQNNPNSSHYENSDTSQETGNFDIFEILDYIFDNDVEQNIQQTYNDFDQCIIN